MQSIVPVFITLELARSAPYVNFSFSNNTKEELLNCKRKLRKMKRKIGARIVSHQEPSSSNPSSSSSAAPPTLPENAASSSEPVQPTQANCFGRRNYAEVVIETFLPNTTAADKSSRSLEPECSTSAGSTMDDRAVSVEPPSVKKMTYYSGNPFIEKTTGVLHFYRPQSNEYPESGNCSMLCMIGVPTYMSCSDLINFVQPADYISEIKIVHDSTPNKYMAILKFNSYRDTMSFFAKYNGTPFSPVESERCTMLFVEKIETTTENAGGSLPHENLTELPTCAVCLERLDDSIVTVLCNHSFHAFCIQQWNDATCPVCRHIQTPEEVDLQKCSDCGRTQDLWMCLVCGNIACGRYVQGHAYRHFETTTHTFTLQVGGNLVWDYAGDNYVHRIVQNANDGKLVEVQSGRSDDDKQGDKFDDIQLEFSCMLTQQLEKQRNYFEEKLQAMEDSIKTFKDQAATEVADLKTQLAQSKDNCDRLEGMVKSLKDSKDGLEKKLATVISKNIKMQQELNEEKEMASVVREARDRLAAENKEAKDRHTSDMNELKEQLSDLMLHFEAQNKIEAEMKGQAVTKEEIEESSVVIGEGTASRTPRRRKKKVTK